MKEDVLQQHKTLGINGLGRIGKLTFWNHLHVGHFDRYVLNAGRQVGRSLEDVIDVLSKDSTYGSIDRFLYGYTGQSCEVKIINREDRVFSVNGKEVKVLVSDRNPRNIKWAQEGVKLVIDCTGVFVDPTVPVDAPQGSVRGHLEAGAEKVVVSAPFKIKDNSKKMPPDSGMFVYGVNHIDYDPQDHHIVSAASCTTTGLAHMVKPLLENKETSEIITASMSTVHAATNNQSILDAVPKKGAKDLRKNRSVFNNIIPTTTGAAVALEKIMPQIKEIGFMADSVRVPVNTASLITLNITFNTGLDEATGAPVISRDFLNDIYEKAGRGDQKDLLLFSTKQNVSSDIIGYRSAIVIEGVETHTRTGFMPVYASALREHGLSGDQDLRIPVTHAKIFGWYDNELGSYVNLSGRLAVYMDKNMA